MPYIPPARRLIPVLVAGLFIDAAAWAADATVNVAPVVVTGSRVEHNTLDLPASADVVDERQIHEGQARVNASEALAGVPGLVVLNRQNYAQDLQISSRGFGARSAFGVRGVKLIADGIPATMPDGQGQAATFNLDAAERIEVLRGPYSVIYGNHAGGVVQLFTREGRDPASVESTLTAGSYGTRKADLLAQGQVGNIGLLADSSHFTTDGYREHSAATRDQSQVRADIHLSDDQKLTLIGNSLKQDNSQDALGLTAAQVAANPRGVDAAALTFNTRKSIDHLQGGATWEGRFGDHRVQLTAYTGTRSVTQFQSTPVGSQTSSKSSGGVVSFDRDFSGVEARWSGEFATGQQSRLITSAGIEYGTSSDRRKGYNNFIGPNGSTCGVTAVCGVIGTLRRQEVDDVSNISPYVQAEWNWQDWSFTGGLRKTIVRFNVDDQFLTNGNDGGKVSYSGSTPVLGVLYHLTPATNVYASAGKGFETPTMNELFYSGSGGGFNFALKAATSQHYELGLKSLVGSDSRLNVALFQVNTNDELVVDQSSGGRTSYKNAVGTTRRGIELAFDTRWAGGYSGRLAYTQMTATYDEQFNTLIGVNGTQTAKVVAAGNHIPGVPESSFYGELAWKHSSEAWGAALEVVGRGRVFVEDSNTYAAASGFAIANLRLTAQQQQGEWKFNEFFRLDNVFDKSYIGSVIVGDANNRYYEPAPGRSAMIGASLRYQFR